MKKAQKDAHFAFARACGNADHGQDVTFNPAMSQAQARFMGAVAGGKIKKKGLSRDTAKEFVRGVHVKELPERAGRKRR